MSPEQAANTLLQGLNIQRPEQLDLDRIAASVGVTVKYRLLTSCEAQIIGTHERAIVSIREDRPTARQRFSLGHELGHWTFHRGQNFICQTGDIESETAQNKAAERLADQFAAELLMPHYLFDGPARSAKQASLKHINEVAALFGSSEMSTAIRISQLGCFPMMVIYYGPEGRRWFSRSKLIPGRWFPHRKLDSDSFAYDVLKGQAAPTRPMKMDAAAWFDVSNDSDYEIEEESVSVMDGVLTILTIEDDGMLIE